MKGKYLFLIIIGIIIEIEIFEESFLATFFLLNRRYK
jgi:hypothetical protein